MKNAYMNKLIQTKDRAYTKGVVDGMRMGFDVVTIALNHVFGFGEIRIIRLEEKVQKLVNEIVDTADPVVTKAHIEMALQQIRGKGWQSGVVEDEN